MSTPRQVAIEYAARGLPITLCNGKAPIATAWQTKNYTPDEIEREFSRQPALNVGLRFGPGSCIDIEADCAEEERAFQGLFAGCDVPRTPTFRSVRGLHRLFAWSEVLAVTGKAVVTFRGLGIRIGANGKGAHSCVPPSVNTDGTIREWIISPDDCPFAPLPDVVLRRILEANRPEPSRPTTLAQRNIPRSDKADQARRYLARVPGAVEGQRGDDRTFATACLLVLDFGLSADEAWPLLAAWNETCDPPWDEKRLRRKLDEADKQPGARGGKLRQASLHPTRRADEGAIEAAFLEAEHVDDDCHEPNGQLNDLINSNGHAADDDRFSIKRLTSREFDGGNYSRSYLVDDVLAEGEPLVIAAALKTMKTSLAVALAVSLALARAFLGKFWVREAVNVLLISGESGLSTLQSIGRRVAESHGYSLGDIGRLYWSTDLPRLGPLDHLEAIREALTRDEINVLIVDPLYFMLPGEDAGNLMIVGGYLRTLSRICDSLGVTLVVVHHIKKTGIENRHDPPELSHISWSGTAEWARQWLLLSRRKPYVPGSGEHELWMVTGGSAGHSTLTALNINEGVGDERGWAVETLTADDVRGDDVDRREQAAEAKRAVQLDRDKRAIVQAMLKLPDKCGTKTDIKERFSGAAKAFNPAMAALLDSGDVLACEISKGNKQTYTGYRLNDATI